jgi:hypothetical protein
MPVYLHVIATEREGYLQHRAEQGMASAMLSEGAMNEASLIGSWIRRFLVEHLVSERNLARNTRLNYRDALTQLKQFAAKTE